MSKPRLLASILLLAASAAAAFRAALRLTGPRHPFSLPIGPAPQD
jgi:hypothetical protein